MPDKGIKTILLIIILIIVIGIGTFLVYNLDSVKFLKNKLYEENMTCEPSEKVVGINPSGVMCAVDISPSYSGGGITTDISGLVPYTSATKNVNLNSKNLTSTGYGRFGDIYYSYLGDNSGRAGFFTNGVNEVSLIAGGEAINVIGTSFFAGNITAWNITGDYFFGNGSKLTDIMTDVNFTIQNASINNYIKDNNNSVNNYILYVNSTNSAGISWMIVTNGTLADNVTTNNYIDANNNSVNNVILGNNNSMNNYITGNNISINNLMTQDNDSNNNYISSINSTLANIFTEQNTSQTNFINSNNGSFVNTYVPYTGANKNVNLGTYNVTSSWVNATTNSWFKKIIVDTAIQWLEHTGVQNLFYINPLNGDGFRMEYWYDFELANDDWLIFRKTDGNDITPDGGIGFVMTNNESTNKTILKLDGYGNANFTDQNITTTGNVKGNMIYGGMKWESSDADNSANWLVSPIMTTAGTFYNFSNSTPRFSLTAPNLNGFTFVNGNALTAQVSGLYKFDGTCDYYTKSNAHTDMTLFVNGVETNFSTHRTAPKSLNIQPISIQNVTTMSVFASDLLYADGTGLTFNELNGGLPVLDANFTFNLTQITNPLFITFSGYYLGSDSHEIEVTVWNFTSKAWVNVRTATKDIPHSGLIPYTQTWKFPDSTQDTRRDFINSTGAVIVRIQHTSNGVSSHVLFVDAFTLQERRVFDRQTITGFARINAGDTAWVMMKKDFNDAQSLIQRFNVNLIRVGD